MDVHGRDLRYFVAVADRLSFTAAAEALYISQPALSKQIRRLESHLGAALFVRDSRSVALTPVGAALLPHALGSPISSTSPSSRCPARRALCVTTGSPSTNAPGDRRSSAPRCRAPRRPMRRW